jgi:hypothetical protein
MTTTKHQSTPLVEEQVRILSDAAERPDRTAARPETMTARAFTRVAKELIERGLLVEEPLSREARSPERMGKSHRRMLHITAAGLDAVRAVTKPAGTYAHRGTKLLGPRKRRNIRLAEAGSIQPRASDAPAHAAETNSVALSRPGTKRALLVALLSRPEGASIAQLSEATGWLPHTTRAALTGLRQSGSTIERAKAADGTTIYMIVGISAGQATEGVA